MLGQAAGRDQSNRAQGDTAHNSAIATHEARDALPEAMEAFFDVRRGSFSARLAQSLLIVLCRGFHASVKSMVHAKYIRAECLSPKRSR